MTSSRVAEEHRDGGRQVTCGIAGAAEAEVLRAVDANIATSKGLARQAPG